MKLQVSWVWFFFFVILGLWEWKFRTLLILFLFTHLGLSSILINLRFFLREVSNFLIHLSLIVFISIFIHVLFLELFLFSFAKCLYFCFSFALIIVTADWLLTLIAVALIALTTGNWFSCCSYALVYAVYKFLILSNFLAKLCNLSLIKICHVFVPFFIHVPSQLLYFFLEFIDVSQKHSDFSISMQVNVFHYFLFFLLLHALSMLMNFFSSQLKCRFSTLNPCLRKNSLLIINTSLIEI